MNTSTSKAGLLRLLSYSIVVPAVNALVHWRIFLFFRDAELNPILYTVLAILWGVLGVYTIYLTLNWVVEQYSPKWKNLVQPFVFVGPAFALLVWLLIIPTIRTVYLSLLDASSENFIGLANYAAVFTDRLLLVTLRNNLLWVFFGTTACVVIGLLVATLADRSSFEKTAKAIVFMPMAVSMVASGVIWKFVYYYQPGAQQIGLLNAILLQLGGDPKAWTSILQPWNNLFLIAILIWMQTGFAMVIFSAAIKGIPEDTLEAARVDGASEIRIFFSIIIPYISNTILAVTTTIVVFTLKIFDVIMVMTGGQYDTDVVATQFYRQFFMYRNFGYGSTLAIVLLIAIIPVLIFNLRQFRKQGGF